MEDRERTREAGLRFGDMLRERLRAGRIVVGGESAEESSLTGSADGGERQPPPEPGPRDMNDVLRGKVGW